MERNKGEDRKMGINEEKKKRRGGEGVEKNEGEGEMKGEESGREKEWRERNMELRGETRGREERSRSAVRRQSYAISVVAASGGQVAALSAGDNRYLVDIIRPALTVPGITLLPVKDGVVRTTRAL